MHVCILVLKIVGIFQSFSKMVALQHWFIYLPKHYETTVPNRMVLSIGWSLSWRLCRCLMLLEGLRVKQGSGTWLCLEISMKRCVPYWKMLHVWNKAYIRIIYEVNVSVHGAYGIGRWSWMSASIIFHPCISGGRNNGGNAMSGSVKECSGR